jgi:hypothetical protein
MTEPIPHQPFVAKHEKSIFAPDTHGASQSPTHGREVRSGDGIAPGRTQGAWKGFERQLAAYNLEARGIQRVEPDERQELRSLDYYQVAIMWFSVNLAANNITLGMLGPAVFTLGFLDSCMTSIFGALVGSLVVAYIATFGPKSGNRTMIFSRYGIRRLDVSLKLTMTGTSWAGGLRRLSLSSTSSCSWAMG